MKAGGDNPEPLRRSLPRRVALWLAAVASILVVTGLGLRFGVRAPVVQGFIEAQLDGVPVGRIGYLGVEGLSGDVWRDLRVRRLTIRDREGVWLDAANLRLVWTPSALIGRTFLAESLQCDSIRLIRRPILSAPQDTRPLPVSIRLVKVTTQLESLPAFSYRRGLFDVDLALDVQRRGRQSGVLAARSRLHPGDHLGVTFDVGKTGPLHIAIQSEEALGGAIAGSLGLAADRPFRLDVRADGSWSRGQFRALATSGAESPLIAQGAWTPAGGSGGGRFDLAASTLTAGLGQRLGGEIRFGIAGRRTSSDRFALDALATSPALSVHARGFGDLRGRTLGREGLQVDAQAPSLSRVLGGPEIGPATFSGRLTGEPRSWRLAGTGAVSDLKIGGYALARMTGPLELSGNAKGLALDARITAAGGRGSGYAAALLGGAPTGRVSAERLSNGQILIKRIDVVGRGLKVEASGARGLLGGLTLKGQAQVSNLSAAKTGASGTAKLTWMGAQARADAGWSFQADARGERMATGVQELDRLLGAAPRLQVQGSWQPTRLELARADLDGEAISVRATGAISSEQALAFKASWTARGPFHAGPLELSGEIKGAGELSGTRTTPQLSLTANIDQIDVPRLPLRDARLVLTFAGQASEAAGALSLTAASEYGPVRAQTGLDVSPDGVDLRAFEVDGAGVRARGSVVLRGLEASTADLDLEVGPGAFLAAGRLAGDVNIVVQEGETRARLEMTAQRARWAGSGVTVRSGRLSAEGPIRRIPYKLTADGGSSQGGWSLTGHGAFTKEADARLLTFDGAGQVGKRDLKTVETARIMFGSDGRSARVRLAGPDGGRLDLQGDWRGAVADVRAQAVKMNLSLFNPDLDGDVDATLAVTGEGRRLDGTLDARLSAARARGSPAGQGLNGSLTARLTGDDLVVRASATNPQGLTATTEVTFPAEASAAPFRVAIARQRPLRGRFSADGEVRPLWDLLIGGGRALSGHVRTQGTLSGTLADPRVSGDFAVERGRFDDAASGLSLRDVVLRADLDRDSVNITEAHGSDARAGRITGQGRISLQRAGASTLRLDLQGFRLIDNETATANATGQATVTRGADGQVKLTGDLILDRADVAAEPPVPSGVVAMDVVEINRPDNLPATLAPRLRRGDGWALDVRLRAPRRVFLKGRGLDIEFSLDAHVGGSTAQAELTGVARVVRGDYDFAGKRFAFDDRSSVTLSTRPENIRLQLDAKREDPSLTVGVRIRGTAARPEISFVSTPSLPNDEVLAQVLFGRSASQLSPVEAAQLASALSSLTGGGGLDVIGNLRSFAGLDRLAFAGGNAAGVTVSGGKYLTDDIYLELTGGGRDGPSAQVEWRVRRNLSILSRLAGQAGNRLAVRWRKDY